MIQILYIFVATVLIVEASFDIAEFKKSYCLEDPSVLRRTNFYIPYSSVPNQEKTGCVCEDFILNKTDLDSMASQSSTLCKDSTQVFFSNCKIHYLSVHLFSMFPNSNEFIFENCTVGLNTTNTADAKLPRGLAVLGFHKCNITDNLKSKSFQKIADSNMYYFWLSDSTLQYPIIDEYFLPATIIQEFLIDKVNVESISGNWLPRSRDVQAISCTSCELKEINSIFKNFKGKVVKKFLFNDNFITELPSSLNIFATFVTLDEINLSGNRIQAAILRRVDFKSLNKLTKLDLSRNTKISGIGYLAFRNTALIFLNMSNVNLEFLNQLGATNLANIDFSNNKISVISTDAFADLPNLKFLDLSHNEISKLENGVFLNEGNLVELRLSHNKLSVLAKETVSKLSNLQILDLSYNDLKMISGLDQLTNLLALNLQSNALNTIPSNLASSSKLRELDISRNDLHFIWKMSFDKLASLHTLDISYTNSSYIYFDAESFKPLTNLKILRMKGNQLTSIENVFLPTSLEELDLALNSIRDATKNNLGTLTHLKHLNFSQNNMRVFEKDLFTSLTMIEDIDLSGSIFVDENDQ